jgi:hypothetical protein
MISLARSAQFTSATSCTCTANENGTDTPNALNVPNRRTLLLLFGVTMICAVCASVRGYQLIFLLFNNSERSPVMVHDSRFLGTGFADVIVMLLNIVHGVVVVGSHLVNALDGAMTDG